MADYGDDLEVDPDRVSGLADVLRGLDRLECAWPEVSGCQDDPVAAAVAGLGNRLWQMVAQTHASVGGLATGLQDAVAAYEQTDQGVADSFEAKALSGYRID